MAGGLSALLENDLGTRTRFLLRSLASPSVPFSLIETLFWRLIQPFGYEYNVLTTGDLKHTTKLPAGISSDRAIEVLHTHALYISCDPHLVKFESIARPPTADDPMPHRCRDDVEGEAMFYALTDKVQKLPAGLWEGEVTSIYELVNLKRGLFVRLRSQLGVMMETVWDVLEDEAGGVAVNETVLIKSPRLLIGIVKSLCENDWRVVHGKLLDIMGGKEKA